MVILATTIEVSHNMEVAHRLFLQPGKCQNIHGHGMQVHLTLAGAVNEDGIFGGIDFSDLKKLFRKYIDETYDHRLLLNSSDPYAHPLFQMARGDDGEFTVDSEQVFLPGVQPLPGDPTTENLALWIAQGMAELIKEAGWVNLYWMEVRIDETCTNAAMIRIGLERFRATTK